MSDPQTEQFIAAFREARELDTIALADSKHFRAIYTEAALSLQAWCQANPDVHQYVMEAVKE